jgi:hypothetical protein
VRALEPAIALGGTWQQLTREGLLAMRAYHFVLFAGGLAHLGEGTYGR